VVVGRKDIEGGAMGFLTWIQDGSIATWVRESISLWAYPTIVAFHAIGLAFLVGTNVVLNLRVLGVAPQVPITAFRGTIPVMWTGFGINAFTGLLLTMASATKFLTNPIFLTKLACIALAVTTLIMLKNRLLGSVETNAWPRNVKVLAVASLVFWFVAIVMGRLTAYPLLLIELFGS
jgi:hypothetical protein